MFMDLGISKFIPEPFYLLLEDETHSTRHYRHTAKCHTQLQLKQTCDAQAQDCVGII